MAGHPARPTWVIGAATLAAIMAVAVVPASAPPPASRPPAEQQPTDPAVACQGWGAGGRPVACPHGNDTPPPGVSLYHRPTLEELQARTTLHSRSPRLRGLAALEQSTTAATPSAPAAVPCIGDGTSGNRIQTIYARSPLVADRYDSLLASFRQWAAEADQATWLSAAETGGGRRLRFVTDGTCQLQVARVLLTPAGEADFDLMRTELQVLGYNRSDRKYLVWVDAAAGICGLGEVYDDQRPTTSNWNNGGPMYARVDAPCWHYAELHEIFHTLGAVQPDTPHRSAARHCTDEADVMCYDDDGGGPVTMTTTCPPEHEVLLDCGHDDYFSTNPPAGNYLAGHWNTATSSFLEPAIGAQPARLTLTGATTITYGGHASLGGRLTDQESGAGIAGQPVNLWRRPATTTGWQQAGTATTGPDGSFRLAPAPAATTAYRASFAGSDQYATAESAQLTVRVRTKVTARKSASRLRRGQTFTVTGTVSPNHAGQRVYLQRLVNGAWKTAATATLSTGSRYTLRAKPPKGRLTYRVYKGADRDHVASASARQAVTVT
ncbi:MAG TPA: carboxypeptidase-like regulatory domain-containing protein [Actinomycetota bacterium]|nr:carboxypeptidase-like regulatory domain-containing protein [Actinomycetota bacterium]